MSLSEWAKNEVALACANERKLNGTPEGEWDYGCACYESALKALNALMEDGHTGYSIKLTKSILNRLIDGRPLMPIEDTEDVWNLVNEYREMKRYQCRRMSSLFKNVYPDGTVKYNDVDRYYAFNMNNEDDIFTIGIISNIVNEMLPITMPYSPYERPIVVYCADTKYDDPNYDKKPEPLYMRKVLYLVIQNDKFERIEIDRIFVSRASYNQGDWVELPKHGVRNFFKEVMGWESALDEIVVDIDYRTASVEDLYNLD